MKNFIYLSRRVVTISLLYSTLLTVVSCEYNDAESDSTTDPNTDTNTNTDPNNNPNTDPNNNEDLLNLYNEVKNNLLSQLGYPDTDFKNDFDSKEAYKFANAILKMLRHYGKETLKSSGDYQSDGEPFELKGIQTAELKTFSNDDLNSGIYESDRYYESKLNPILDKGIKALKKAMQQREGIAKVMVAMEGENPENYPNGSIWKTPSTYKKLEFSKFKEDVNKCLARMNPTYKGKLSSESSAKSCDSYSMAILTAFFEKSENDITNNLDNEAEILERLEDIKNIVNTNSGITDGESLSQFTEDDIKEVCADQDPNEPVSAVEKRFLKKLGTKAYFLAYTKSVKEVGGALEGIDTLEMGSVDEAMVSKTPVRAIVKFLVQNNGDRVDSNLETKINGIQRIKLMTFAKVHSKIMTLIHQYCLPGTDDNNKMANGAAIAIGALYMMNKEFDTKWFCTVVHLIIEVVDMLYFLSI